MYIAGNYTGYGIWGGNREEIFGMNKVDMERKGLDCDIRRFLNNAFDSQSSNIPLYNPELDITLINYQLNDAFGRPGLFQIGVKGQVSEADALALTEYLKSKDMLPKGSINQFLEKHYFSTPQPLASRIQDC